MPRELAETTIVTHQVMLTAASDLVNPEQVREKSAKAVGFKQALKRAVPVSAGLRAASSPWS